MYMRLGIESPLLQLLIPVNGDSSFRPPKFNRILYVCFFSEIANGVYKYSSPDKSQCSNLHVERGSLTLFANWTAQVAAQHGRNARFGHFSSEFGS